MVEQIREYTIVQPVREADGLTSYQTVARGGPGQAPALGSPPIAALRPNPLRRERWVDLGELYPGHQLLFRFNPNKRNLPKLPDDASEEARIMAGLKRVVLAHRIHFDDGTPDSPWIDPDTDQALPPPSDDGFWDAISNDVLVVIMRHVEDDQKKVTASIDRNVPPSRVPSPASESPSPNGSPGD